jgi:hypothetical protein
MPSFDYNDPKAWNHGTFAIASELDDDNGSLVITTPHLQRLVIHYSYS